MQSNIKPKSKITKKEMIEIERAEYEKKMKGFTSLTYEIPLAPVTKKNHQQIVRSGGRTMVLPSSQYRQYESDCWVFLRHKPPVPINEPIEVTCLFYMPDKRRVDLTNLLESIDDILSKYNIIADDNSKIIVSHDGSRVGYDKERPRTVIHIRKYKESESKDESNI